VKRLLSLDELNKVLVDRGLEITEMCHPDGLVETLAKMKFWVIFDDEEQVKFGRDKFVDELDLHRLNFLLDDRRIQLLHFVNEDHDLFGTFTGDVSLKLKFKVKRKGVWVPPWDNTTNTNTFMRMYRSPVVRRFDGTA